MARFTKILILFLEGNIKIISYERRDLIAVDSRKDPYVPKNDEKRIKGVKVL